MTSKAQFASLLSQRRKELRLSQTDLADRMGVTQSSVSHWEQGDIESMTPDAITRLGSILEVPASVVADALGYPIASENEDRFSERDIAWLRQFPDHLTDEAWSFILDFARYQSATRAETRPNTRTAGAKKGATALVPSLGMA